MAAKYQDYLAAQVLSGGLIINYRNVSRALKVRVNVAKQMLYEFHRIQSRRKPGSIHATYLICGERKVQRPETNGFHAREDDDMEMQDECLPPSSAPGPSSSLPPSSVPEPAQDATPNEVPVTSITIVREEELDAVKQQHSRIDALHVYSLEPGTIENVQLLSDCSRRVLEEQAKEDPLETWNQYGTIHNPRAKRRTGARPPQPAPPPAAPVTAGMKAVTKPATNAVADAKDQNSRPSSSEKDISKESKASNPAALRRESSSLFKSFAKTKPPEEKEEPRKAEDESMAEPSDDEEDEMAALPEPSKEAKEKVAEDRKAKAEREATLKKMMEDDEVEENEASQDDDAEMEDAAIEEPSDSAKDAQDEPAADETKDMATSGGRRRGRRRVMKKKHFKDAEGYMVTKEEPIWESFSEDDEPPPSKKTAPSNNTFKSTAKDEKGKKGGKPGQGNIMNFFSKQ